MKAPMRDRFDATGLSTKIGSHRFYPTVRAAVRAYSDEQTRMPV